MRKRKGFTLVEIMIVVAIIALLASIAIPNLLTARKSANDAAAKAELQTIQTAIENYAIDNGNYTGQAADRTNLSYLVPTYLREDVDSKVKAGHTFDCTVSVSDYTCTANVSGSQGTANYTLTPVGINKTN